MKAFAQLTIQFVIAALIAFVFASIFHTQFVLHELIKVGAEISFTTRIDTTFGDLLGLAPGYGPIVALALLLGFLIMLLVRRFFPALGFWIYPIAGFVAIATAHLAMHPIFNVTLIAGARGTLGLLFQCLAGALGGYVFMKFRSTEGN